MTIDTLNTKMGKWLRAQNISSDIRVEIGLNPRSVRIYYKNVDSHCVMAINAWFLDLNLVICHLSVCLLPKVIVTMINNNTYLGDK